MISKQEALQELIFDSLQELKAFVKYIELRSFKKGSKKQVCVIVFSNFFALKEWRAKEASILSKMRELYKQRELKKVAVFHKVIAEIQGQNHFYKERSKGDFEIISDTPEIRAIFENIKARIKEMKEKERRK